MKTIFILITIITLSVSCKKQKSVEPAPVTPVKTSKSFYVYIKYQQDSLGSYYISSATTPAFISFRMSIKSPNDPSFDGAKDYVYGNLTGGYVGFVGTINHKELIIINSADINKPLTYYITLVLGLYAVDGIHNRYTETIKQYTFNEGDNGTIDFKTIP